MGIFALSFMCHNIALDVLKKNEKPQKRQKKNLQISYLITVSIYAIIGFLGLLGISWRPEMQQNPFPTVNFLLKNTL